MTLLAHRLGRIALVAWTVACTRSEAPGSTAPIDYGFAQLIERLSEPGGYFPSDNLVSNETSYLHALSDMREIGVHGGAYLGVGPDQNYSYIAQVRPEIAFLIDIRRDNMLQHLLYKALFELAETRVEYLALLLGKPAPDDPHDFEHAGIDGVIDYFDSVPSERDLFEAAASRVRRTVQRYGVPLDETDLATIRQIHYNFHQRGFEIRYSYSSRHPMWRRLLEETDKEGNQLNYLASEQSFRVIKDLHRRNLIIPVTGDLAGPHALAAIGREVEQRGLHVSAFYVSNVEQYLFRGGSFKRFANTVAGLPRDSSSVIIRSYFGRGFGLVCQRGHSSQQFVDRIDDFVGNYEMGEYSRYEELVHNSRLSIGC